MVVLAFARTSPSFGGARHMSVEQIRMAKAEAKRLPSGWFKPETWNNADEVTGYVQHGLYLRQIDGAPMGNFLITRAGGGFEVNYLEGGEWASNSKTLGNYEIITDAVDAIVTLIRTTLSGWGLQLAA